MTYQHDGKKYSDWIHDPPQPIEKSKIIKKYFMIQFECIECQKRHRLKILKIDPMKRFHCTHCKNDTFRIVQQQVGETSISGKDNIVMIENYIKRVD